MIVLQQVMDNVCSKGIKEYVVASYKASGKPTLLRLTTADGNMNSEMSNVDIVPNPEVNEKLVSLVDWLFNFHNLSIHESNFVIFIPMHT